MSENMQNKKAEAQMRAAILNILEDAREVQKKLEEEKQRHLAVIENLTDGILVFDNQKVLYLLNQKSKDYLGLSDSEVLGKPLSELVLLPQLAPLAGFLNSDLSHITRKDIAIKDGFIVEMSSRPLVVDGESRGYIVILRNVTRERSIERMKTEFVSLAAHQLRTPLSAIKWILKMLLEGDVGKLSQEQVEILQKSYQRNEQMIRLINELLEVTRMEEGRYLSSPTLIFLEPLVKSVVASFQEEAKRRDLELRFNPPEEKLPQVKVDAEKIRLVISNLVDNAIHYTLSPGEVTVSLGYAKKGVEVRVQDTGIGIPKNQQDRVFERFFRGVNALRLETEGSGLGLYIAKNIVKAHGGRIWFTSEENKGSTFYFWLPEAQ